MPENGDVRIQKDSLGEVKVPARAYYGAQTARAVFNFPISGLRAPTQMIRATAMVKQAAAAANLALGELSPERAKAITQAAKEIVDGRWHEQFVVDVFQAGAGTSHNMNANEVIANRANELLGQPLGTNKPVHPNDHVNMAQSTNDIYPTAMRVANLLTLAELYPALDRLERALRDKGHEFDGIVKSGRTHLQDAVPVRMGQEFIAYAEAVKRGSERIRAASEALQELNIGGTAAGTGLNSHPRYQEEVVKHLGQIAGFEFRKATNLQERMQSMADFADVSGALKVLALELIRIANDLRLLTSGPFTGIAEIVLPAVQPGSSIMPGKVNPVMAEMLDMVCFQVVGNDLAVAMATQAGQLELNVMMPVINFNLLFSIQILTNAVRVFVDFCVVGITANGERARNLVERSSALATALNPYIGYEAAAKVAQEAVATGRTIREIVLERGLLTPAEMDQVLDPVGMTTPRLRLDIGTARREP
ncbi:MAG: aspartate ammonia-lyase [Chloroflexota bacterium]